jgi:hypothetical protein
MTWIKTVRPADADAKLIDAFQGQARLYPQEYAIPVEALAPFETAEGGAGIVLAHSLLPATLYHTFSTYGTLLSPELPLSRRRHEMIAATVSALNSCFY